MTGTREIPLSGGKVAIVDANDFETLTKHKWKLHCNGYASRSTWQHGKRTSIYMHRAIMQPNLGLHVDHIDGNKLNNTRTNLRLCTPSQNHINKHRPVSHKQTSQYKGVSAANGGPKWRARIVCAQQSIELGIFDSEIEAAQAYDRKAIELFGSFAALNFPNG